MYYCILINGGDFLSNAVGARLKGDSYQALFFWLKACEIFDEDTNIKRIVYESSEVKSLDDIVIYYKKPFLDENSNLIDKDFFQIKFHVTQNGTINWQDLIDPTFINAAKHSFFKRVYEAQDQYSTEQHGSRFYLVTPWNINPNDDLSQIISNTGGEIRWDKLNVGKTRGKMWGVRKEWRTHLNLKDDLELERFLSSIRIKDRFHTLEELKNLLNIKLNSVGLKRIADFGLNPYTDLLQSLLLKNATDFDRESLIMHCKNNDLFVDTKNNSVVHTIGIRSFTRGTEKMTDETDAMICLIDRFNNRNIIEIADWTEHIPQKMKDFLEKKSNPHLENQIFLDTHSSIAFLSGYLLDSKSGIKIAPIQKYNGKTVWKPNFDASPELYPKWVIQESITNEQANDLVITLDIRHNISQHVEYYLKGTKLPIHRIINCCLPTGPSASAIKDGSHAWYLADTIASYINNRPFNERFGTVHIFSSVPNALMFFLGQLSRSFGKVQLYEFDFDNPLPGAYTPSISLPLKS